MKSTRLWAHHRRLYFITICCLWATLLALVLWSCVRYGQFSHSKDQCQERTTSIGFDGDEDFYGLGIRLGVYLQWSASLIATALQGLEHERRRLTGAYIGAQIAMLAAFLALMFRDSCVFTAEAIVILYFLLGGIASVLGPDLMAALLGGRDPELLRLSDFAGLLLISLVATISSWFWIRLAAVGDGADFMSTPGGTIIFLFDDVHNTGLKVASAYMAIICLYLALGTLEKAFVLIYTRLFLTSLDWEPPSLLIFGSLIVVDEILRRLGSLVPDCLVPTFLLKDNHPFFCWYRQGMDRVREDIENMFKHGKTLRHGPNRTSSKVKDVESCPQSLRDALEAPTSVSSRRYIYGFVVKM
jgi:hypothetical protein